MKTLLLDLALRGTWVTLVVVLLDVLLNQRQQPRYRRLWWFLVGLAWILPLHLPHRGSIPSLPLPSAERLSVGFLGPVLGSGAPLETHASIDRWEIVLAIWLVGAVVSFSIVAIRTALTVHRWSGVRLCTDPELLDLLEDTKATAGVRAPIGLVLTPSVSSPALLGWLRPRILLPEQLVKTISRDELRGVFLHELAHFRSADIPMQWLFCLAQSLHWFNPLAHLATRRWMQFREVAADAAALSWMPATSRHAYGDALLAAIREANPLPLPRGALALGESFQQLKLRITMIAQNQTRARLLWLATIVSVALASAILLPRTALAEATSSSEDAAKSVARAAGDTWLGLMDNGKYTDSWDSASAMFKGAVSSEKWSAMGAGVRTPLGKLISRNFASALYQKNPPQGAKTITGEFVIEQFDSSFENMKTARETVTLMKDADGQWRAAGYFIKPN